MVGTLRFAHPTPYDFCELICLARKRNLDA
jgi:hypothetical protein